MAAIDQATIDNYRSDDSGIATGATPLNQEAFDYVAASFRHPMATDAYHLGFLPGVREDYDYQLDDVRNVELTVGFLDNDFRDPDRDRYLDRFHAVEPTVAVVGDAPTADDAARIQTMIDDLQMEYPDTTYIAVPKCKAAFVEFAPETVIGYPNGYSAEHPDDYSTIGQWRGKDIHVLGGAPDRQLAAIDRLTRPTLFDDPPATIRGVDSNVHMKTAYVGEYWTPDGYRRADHLSIRETVDQALQETKQFWQAHDLWPVTTPVDEYGPAVTVPDDPVYATGDDITTKEKLEHAIVEEYAAGGIRAYQSATAQAFVESRDGLTTER